MGLFGNNYKKRYDYEEDGLIPKFNIYRKQYSLYIPGPYEIIATEDELNRRSKKYLKKLNKKLHNDKELFNQELEKAQAIEEHKKKVQARAKELRELGYGSVSFEVRGTTPGSIDKETEDYLIPMLSEDKVLVGLHRASFTPEGINYIFENGFIMTGGITNIMHEPPLHENFGYYFDNMEILEEVKYASGYKNSNGSLLIRIPDEDLKGNKMFDDIWTKDTCLEIVDGKEVYTEKEILMQRTLKREYILGYVPTDKDFNAGKIILNPYSTYNKQLFEKNNNLENVVNNDKTTEALANELLAKEEKLETTQELKIR